MRIVTLSIIALLATTAGCIDKKLASMMPDDWYVLPEDARSGSVRNRGDQALLRKTTQQLFLSQTALLENATADQDEREKADEPWKLVAFITDLSVSFEGALGALVLEGSPAVQVVYTRPNIDADDPGRPSLRRPEPAPAQVRLTSDRAVFDRNVEAFSKATLASGRVRDDARFSQALRAIADDFARTATALDEAPVSAKWKPVGYRLEVGFDASGAVTPVTTVGVAVTLRFDWERHATVSPIGGPPKSVLGRNLAHFARVVGQDLDALTEEENGLTKEGFGLEGVLLSIGVSVEGDIGVVTTAGSLTGTIEFARVEAAPGALPLLAPSLDERLARLETGVPLFVDAKLDPLRARYAQTLGLGARPVKFHDGVSGRNLYKISREKFRKGLRKATSISSFFLAQSKVAQTPRWEVSELSTAFSLSLSGTVGVVTVGGTGGLELVWAKP